MLSSIHQQHSKYEYTPQRHSSSIPTSRYTINTSMKSNHPASYAPSSRSSIPLHDPYHQDSGDEEEEEDEFYDVEDEYSDDNETIDNETIMDESEISGEYEEEVEGDDEVEDEHEERQFIASRRHQPHTLRNNNSSFQQSPSNLRSPPPNPQNDIYYSKIVNFLKHVERKPTSHNQAHSTSHHKSHGHLLSQSDDSMSLRQMKNNPSHGSSNSLSGNQQANLYRSHSVLSPQRNTLSTYGKVSPANRGHYNQVLLNPNIQSTPRSSKNQSFHNTPPNNQSNSHEEKQDEEFDDNKESEENEEDEEEDDDDDDEQRSNDHGNNKVSESTGGKEITSTGYNSNTSTIFSSTYHGAARNRILEPTQNEINDNDKKSTIKIKSRNQVLNHPELQKWEDKTPPKNMSPEFRKLCTDDLDPNLNYVVHGSSGAGKTSFVLNLMYWTRKVFDVVVFICPTAKNRKLYQQLVPRGILFDKVNPKKIREIWEQCEELSKRKAYNVRIVFDDCMIGKMDKKFEELLDELLKAGRHSGLSLVIIIQQCNAIPKRLRDQFHVNIQLGGSGEDVLKQFHTMYVSWSMAKTDFVKCCSQMGKGVALILDKMNTEKPVTWHRFVEMQYLPPFTLCSRDFWKLWASFGLKMKKEKKDKDDTDVLPNIPNVIAESSQQLVKTNPKKVFNRKKKLEDKMNEAIMAKYKSK